MVGRWSNLSEQGERLQALVEIIPSGPINPIVALLRSEQSLCRSEIVRLGHDQLVEKRHNLFESYKRCAKTLTCEFVRHVSRIRKHSWVYGCEASVGTDDLQSGHRNGPFRSFGSNGQRVERQLFRSRFARSFANQAFSRDRSRRLNRDGRICERGHSGTDFLERSFHPWEGDGGAPLTSKRSSSG